MSDTIHLFAVFVFGVACGGAVASLMVLLIIRKMERRDE